MPVCGSTSARPTRLERAGYAAAGAAMWSMAVAVVAEELLGWELLEAARAGTVAFFPAAAFSLAVQRRLVERRKNTASREGDSQGWRRMLEAEDGGGAGCSVEGDSRAAGN